MSNEDYAQSAPDEARQGIEVATGKWSKQWLVTSILLGPALGLTAAAMLFYVTPKKFESLAELHFSSLQAGQPFDHKILEAEAAKIEDPNTIAEIEALLLKKPEDSAKHEIPSAEIETQIKGDIIQIAVKHHDSEFARNVANLLADRHKNQLHKENNDLLLTADENIEQVLTEQKKFPDSTQELLQLQSRLQLLEGAKDRYELIVAYASEPSNFRNELLGYQRDYLKPDALTIDSTQAEIAASPRKQDLDRRWLKLIGLMEKHRKGLEAEIAERQKNASTGAESLPLSSPISQPGLFVDEQRAYISRAPKEPVISKYLLTGSVSGLFLLPILSLLGFVRLRKNSTQSANVPASL